MNFPCDDDKVLRWGKDSWCGPSLATTIAVTSPLGLESLHHLLAVHAGWEPLAPRANVSG
jgi:hypothetical protein